jgi:pimeloyl-ACP methyl ester carboxylesterase
MVLMGSVGVQFPIGPGLEQVWGYTPSLANMAELVSLFAHDSGLMTDELVRLRYEASAAPGVQERYAEAFAAPRQRHADAMALTEGELRGIRTPTLLIHGAQDAIVPLEATSMRLVRLLPDADLVVLGRCGHWTQIERAPAFQRAVRDFFAD